VDRCALFVDAGYVLADGAMAVHGTRRRESVSWDYAGLLQLLSSLARERSGLPLLRCYWYEATVEGRRNADHDTLADLPGVKLRVAKMRPGRREGVESEIHRDLTTLARNKAVSDAMVVSAEEDLAQVVSDVQDLGLRVSLLHLAVDGNWTISRTLRQECDDIVEISSAHLRPYVELISGAEPPRPDEREAAPVFAHRPTANGHGPVRRTAAYAMPSADSDNGHQAPPSIYTAPVVAEYQRPAPQLSRSRPDDPAAARDGSQSAEPAAMQDPPARPDLQSVRQDVGSAQRDPLDGPAEPAGTGAADYRGTPDLVAVQPDPASMQQDVTPIWQEQSAVRQEQSAVWQEQSAVRQEPARQDYQDYQDYGAPRLDLPARPEAPARQEIYAAPVAVSAPADDQPIEFPAARSRPVADLSGYNPGAVREQPPRDAVTREPLPGAAGDGLQSVPGATSAGQVRHLPTRGVGQPIPAHGQPAGQPTAGQAAGGQATAGQPAAPVMPIAPAAGYVAARNGSYSGPRPAIPAGAAGPMGPAGAGAPVGLAGQSSSVPTAAGLAGGQQGGSGVQPVPSPVAPVSSPGSLSASGPVNPPGQGPAVGGPGGYVGPVGPAAYSGAQTGVSLADAVQSAHGEGQEFGESVARDAPALWLEAVLARKPRMPSDLEARLLQGSSLPIDFLLHDEVRHALRRGFWDALERARR
jgi:hypothetical protein